MTTRNRFSRKQLKQPDEFVSTSEKVIDYCKKNQGVLLSIIAGVFLIIGLTSLVIHNQEEKELRMENLLAEMNIIKQKYDRNGTGSVIKKLEEYLDQFGDGTHKQRAKLLFADTLYQNRQFQKAISTYNEILQQLRPGNIFYELAQSGLGYSYEGKKEYDKAVDTYKFIIDQGKPLSLFDIYLSLARTYELDNDFKNALLILREMENKFQNHAQIYKVRGRIMRLEG